MKANPEIGGGSRGPSSATQSRPAQPRPVPGKPAAAKPTDWFTEALNKSKH